MRRIAVARVKGIVTVSLEPATNVLMGNGSSALFVRKLVQISVVREELVIAMMVHVVEDVWGTMKEDIVRVVVRFVVMRNAMTMELVD